jgi:hypothetical protein
MTNSDVRIYSFTLGYTDYFRGHYRIASEIIDSGLDYDQYDLGRMEALDRKIEIKLEACREEDERMKCDFYRDQMAKMHANVIGA